MTPFDPHPSSFDVNTFPASFRRAAVALSVLVIAVVLFEAAAVSATVPA